jgi:hypothetical protein
MENRLGADFSTVRVHADSAARASAAELNARAYTAGEHVVIGNGNADKQIFAHELIHVLQQREGPVTGTSHGEFSLSDPADVHERAAEATARRVMSGTGPHRDAGMAVADRPAGTHSAPSPPAIQRVIIIGEDRDANSYEEPADEDSMEYEDAQSNFRDILAEVFTELDERGGEVDVSLRPKLRSLLEGYWKSGEIWVDDIPQLTDMLIEQAEASGRPSTEQRTRAQAIEKISGGSQAKTTRSAKRRQEQLESLTYETTDEINTKRKATEPPRQIVDPTKTKAENKIHTDNRSFKKDFSDEYWRVWKEWSKATGWPILCNVCHQPITDGDERGIDHVVSWNNLKTGVKTREVCKAGFHWTVALQKDVDKVVHDGSTDPSDLKVVETGNKFVDDKGNTIGVEASMNRGNLQPTHKDCNSSKNAPKGFDSIAPQRVGKGPAHGLGDHCSLPKAE